MGQQPDPSNRNSDAIWDFINNEVPMDDIKGQRSGMREPEDLHPAVYQETADNPLQNYMPHDHGELWKMVALAEDSSQPEKVEKTQLFLKQCPDGSCRRKVRNTFRNLGRFSWDDDEYETYDG